jgi:hypothetical protein
MKTNQPPVYESVKPLLVEYDLALLEIFKIIITH